MKKETEQELTSAESSRRSLLRLSALLGTGIALPASWVKPVVDSIVLPVHAQTSPGPEPEPEAVQAILNGVEDGQIGTEFTADASASTGPEGADLSFVFSVDELCEIISQSGPMAVIRRGLLVGECVVTVTVSDGNTSDTVSVTAAVTGGPPGTPGG